VKKAAALLRNAGHEKIGFFGGLGMAPGLDKAEPRVSHRLREMLAGLKESVPGFDPEKDAVSDRFDDLSGISKALAEGTHSAWICGELKLCQMLCHCVAKLGLRIPEDVSVAAFTQNLPLYALPGDICRFHSDNPARAAAIISLLEGDFVKDFTPMASECLFIEGASVAAPNPRFKLKTGKAS
jgi:DNA-binding LacI/PurR family transcriptional regulator